MISGADVAVLANPTAGRGRYRHTIEHVMARLRDAGLAPRLLEAPDRTAALAACRAAVADRPAALVTMGGDGTVHLAVQAVAGTGVPLGLVPIGTGNDFVGALGLPTRPEPAAEAVATALTGGHTRRIDVARSTGTDGEPLWYGTVLSAGLDASVNERANRMRWPTGPRRYDLAILAEMVRMAPRDYTLVLDGEPLDLAALIIAVGNTAWYGGGMRICPRADPSDGLLDLTVVGPIGRGTAVRLKSLVRHGTHLDHPAVRHHRAARIEIHGPATHTYADGERAAQLPVTVECVPGALTLLDVAVPA